MRYRSAKLGARSMMRRGMSRRAVVQAGAVVFPGSAAAAESYYEPPSQNDHPAEVAGGGYLFFRPYEAAFVEAAVDRLIPSDESGPGAGETGVAFFIDRQLAGPYGLGDHTYLHAPFARGTPS